MKKVAYAIAALNGLIYCSVWIYYVVHKGFAADTIGWIMRIAGWYAVVPSPILLIMCIVMFVGLSMRNEPKSGRGAFLVAGLLIVWAVLTYALLKGTHGLLA
jgi:hypothetical protein